ncbi:hypothetical protein [Vibrio maerlii]|uniref:hypothetical protein n=1 Tax=Vibrio maerlii TaxID=2231648 RepID=UPI000E3B76B1|nr:hypothetical protein [Vibrio maerlii]
MKSNVKAFEDCSLKIIYFDVKNLLYSRFYVNKNAFVKAAFDKGGFMSVKQVLENVPPDLESARKLAEVSDEIGTLLYPTNPFFYPRDLLVCCNIFAENQLAPFIDLRRKMRLDDSDWLRTTRCHAECCNADWYACGDFEWDERMKMFQDRYFHLSSESGIDDAVITNIRETLL